MRWTRKNRTPRSGAYLVEFAVVAVIFFSFLFGIIEFSRFFFLRNICVNGCREAARWAAVNTQLGPDDTHIKEIVEERVGAGKNMIDGFTVTVFFDDGTGNPVSGKEWSDAVFGEPITVRISGSFTPVFGPLGGFFKDTIKVNFRSSAMSEAN